jgi:pimeloyl-ACP methyl ester carboxylesterase
MAKKRTVVRFAIVVALLLAVAAAVLFLRPLWVYGKFQTLLLRVEGVESSKVLIDGHTIHYYVRGPVDGAPIVLVHGLGGRAEDWMHLAPYLVKAGYRVYTPDLLGFGQSEEPVGASYSIPEQARLVVKFVDAMGITRADFGGWSMGGWIVQKVAVDHPERVRRLVLLDSAGLRLSPDWDTRLFTPTTPMQLNQLSALLMPNAPTLPTFLSMDILRSSARSSWVVKRALASMLSARDVMDAQLPTLKMPVLILWGEQDHITPVREGYAMHALIPQSRIEVAPRCGHLAPQQCASLFGPEMVRFLDANPLLPPGEQAL